MSLAAELLCQLLPPLTFGTDGVVITAALASVHHVGGDAFDYAVNGDSEAAPIGAASARRRPEGVALPCHRILRPCA
jgi:hypothetical protein